MRNILYIIPLILLGSACSRKENSDLNVAEADTTKLKTDFKSDVSFLRRFTEIIVLEEPSAKAKVAVSPALQGRVMTSTAQGEEGFSYGWINRQAFLSGDTSTHMNAFGGEDRFWIGPEGGQYSVYFSKGEAFSLDNWHVPRLIDLEPFDVVASSATEVSFSREAQLTNYSGTVFQLGIERKIRLLRKDEILSALGLDTDEKISVVAYQSVNTLKNTGREPWTKEKGLLSVWILGMFNPSENTTIVVPHQSSSDKPDEVVNDKYFGNVPSNRLAMKGNTIFFRADGKYRSKIGLSSDAATEWIGSYDPDNEVLTLVNYNKQENASDYVNSLWEIQQDPYGGDVINAYNDGPPEPGAKSMGPFYELESSSPAAALGPGESITHIHSTFHISGDKKQIDTVMRKYLGASVEDVVRAFGKN